MLFIGQDIDFSGVGRLPAYTQYRWATAISPSVVVSVYHLRPFLPNDTIVFHLDNDPNGPVIERKIVCVLADRLEGATDDGTWVGLLDQPLTSSVSFPSIGRRRPRTPNPALGEGLFLTGNRNPELSSTTSMRVGRNFVTEVDEIDSEGKFGPRIIFKYDPINGALGFGNNEAEHRVFDSGSPAYVRSPDGDTVLRGVSLKNIELSGFAADLSNLISLMPAGESILIHPEEPGDFDGDLLVDATDLDMLNAVIKSVENGADPTLLYDMDGDDTVNSADLDHVLSLVLHTYMGDVNLDGVVDSTDMGLLLNNFGSTGSFGWTGGDLDGSGTIDSTDLGLLLTNFGEGSNIPGDTDKDGALDIDDLVDILAEASHNGSWIVADFDGSGWVDDADVDAVEAVLMGP